MFYKQVRNRAIISYGICDKLPADTTEIKEAEYKLIDADMKAIDAKTKADAESKAQAERDARIKRQREHSECVNDYIAKVTGGTVLIDDVPIEYKEEVKRITNPPPTDEELQEQLSAVQEAIDFLIMNGTEV